MRRVKINRGIIYICDSDFGTINKDGQLDYEGNFVGGFLFIIVFDLK